MAAAFSRNPDVSLPIYHILADYATTALHGQKLYAKIGKRVRRDSPTPGQIGGVKMKKRLSMRILVIALMSIVVFSVSATVTLAAPQAPVVESELVAEILDASVVGLVASDKGKAVLDGDGRDDGIGPTDGLAGALQVGVDASGYFGALHIQGQYVYGGQPVQELLDAILALHFV